MRVTMQEATGELCKTQLLHYSLSRLFYDLHVSKDLSARYRADPEPILAAYDLADDLKDALRRHDVAALAPHTNGFLLRYYFIAAGVSEPEFLAGLHKIEASARG